MTEKLLVTGNLAKDIFNGEEKFGGSAANLALAAKRLGINVGIMSVLGKDDFSKKYRDYLLENGIDLSLTPQSLNRLPVCEIISKENSISSCLWQDNGCEEEMGELSVDIENLGNYGTTHLVCCPPKLVRKFINSKTNLSYEPGQMLVDDSSYFDMEFANKSSLVFLNEEEYLAVSQDLKTAFLSSNSFSNLIALVVTVGEKGSVLYQIKNGQTIRRSFPPSSLLGEFVDPTGAGDNFKAGFLTGLLKGRSVDECLRIGSDMGAAAVTVQGGVLPSDIIESIKYKFNL